MITVFHNILFVNNGSSSLTEQSLVDLEREVVGLARSREHIYGIEEDRRIPDFPRIR